VKNPVAHAAGLYSMRSALPHLRSVEITLKSKWQKFHGLTEPVWRQFLAIATGPSERIGCIKNVRYASQNVN
jgi:hypothetical protein